MTIFIRRLHKYELSITLYSRIHLANEYRRPSKDGKIIFIKKYILFYLALPFNYSVQFFICFFSSLQITLPLIAPLIVILLL